MAEDIRYEGTSMLNDEGEYLFNKKKTGQRLNATQLLLIGIIVVGCAIFYIEVNRKTVSDVGYSNFEVSTFDASSISKNDRQLLLEKLLAEDPVEEMLESSGEEFEDKIEDQSEFNYESLEEEIKDNEEVETEIERDLEYLLDLSDAEVVERFENRKELFNRECEIQSEFVSKEDLNFTIAHLTNVFYDDKYKLIMCAVPKAATSNWQRVLAVLKYDGTRPPESFHHSNLYNQLNRFSMLAESLGEEKAKLEIIKRLNDPSYMKWINVRHPFARLVSAWRDKFEKTASGESYWMRKYGKFIEAKFGRDEYKPPESHFISLQAFLDYVAWVSNDQRYDHHWKSFNFHCRPCQLKFDYITKAETSAHDSKFILVKANISHLVNLPGMYSDSPQKQTPPEDFYVDSSHETIQRLHHAYRHDFRIFGYSSLSFDKVASGTTPEMFKTRKRREIKLKRQHEFILRHLEKENFKNL